MLRSSGGTAVMILSGRDDSTTAAASPHPAVATQSAPYNFSRPHPPPGSASSMHSSHTLSNGSGGDSSAGGHIAANGVLQGPKPADAANGEAPQAPSTPKRSPNTPSPDRDAAPSAKDAMHQAQSQDDGSYFPPFSNGSTTSTSTASASTTTPPTSATTINGTGSVRPSSIPVSVTSTRPAEHTPIPTPSSSSPRLSPRMSPPTTGAGSGSQLLPSPNLPQQPGSLRQRHTLQVPKPSQGSRTSTPASGSEVVVSGRFSPTLPTPTSTPTPRRHSITMGRRPTRSIHSDNLMEEVPPDEDAARWTEAIKAKRAVKGKSKKRKEEDIDDDKVVVGTKVDHNHANWVTAYNMLTGIRFCVSRINAKMDRPLTDADFAAKHKFSFDM